MMTVSPQGSLVHSLRERNVLPGSGLTTGLFTHTGGFTKSCFLIYGTILRKNEFTGSEFPAELASEFFAGSGSTSIQKSSQDLVQGIQKGVHSSPSKSVVAPKISINMSIFRWPYLGKFLSDPSIQIVKLKLRISRLQIRQVWCR